MRVDAGGVGIEIEEHGPRDGAPVLALRGLGTQLIHWPRAFVAGLRDRGLRVITMDNRDCGLSEKFEHAGPADLDEAVARVNRGEPAEPAYTLDDMANDTVGVLDALGLERVHLLGISLGGMIAQHVAFAHPSRLSSLVSVMSSTGNPDLPRPAPEVSARLTADPPGDGDRQALVDYTLECDRIWGSPGYPFEVAERRALIERAVDRCHCPRGVSRQWLAARHDGSRVERLAGVVAPTLVIHGRDDALLPPEHGRDTARCIPGARYLEIPGMGHDLEGDLALEVVAAVANHIALIGSR